MVGNDVGLRDGEMQSGTSASFFATDTLAAQSPNRLTGSGCLLSQPPDQGRGKFHTSDLLAMFHHDAPAAPQVLG